MTTAAIFCLGLIMSFMTLFDVGFSDPEEMILGTWKTENDTGYEWVFLANGEHQRSRNGELIRERSWQIVNECESETADREVDFAMLKIDRGDHMPSQ